MSVDDPGVTPLVSWAAADVDKQPVDRLRCQGIADPHTGVKGDLLVQTLIEVPKKLSKRQQELLRELAELDEKNITPERKGFMDRIMEYFQLQGTKE